MAQIKPLIPELQKIAFKELNEVPSSVPRDLQALKAWIQQQSYLTARTDDQFLVQFLRCCKYDLAEAKKRVENFFAFKTKFPPTMQTDSRRFREIHNIGCLALLPTPLNDCGPRIAVFRFNYPTNKYFMEPIIEVTNAMFEACIMNDPYICICGLLFVFDMEKLTPDHVQQYTTNLVKQLSAFYEMSLPIRIAGMCFVNVPTIADQFFEEFFTQFSEGIKEKVFICGRNMINITEQIPLKYLPENYGGTNGCLENLIEGHNKVWDDNKEYFQQNAKYGFHEQLRPDGPIDFDGLFSAENFNQIKTSLCNRSR